MNNLDVVLLAAIDPVCRDAASFGLLVDLPSTVLIRHTITPHREGEGGTLRRLISDASGLVRDDTAELAHSCLSCATREDIVPTLKWVAEQGRWQRAVLALPLSGAPEPVAYQIQHAIDHEDLDARLCSVAAVIDPATLIEDLFGDDLLAERGLALGRVDQRSVGEALVSQIEYADTVIGLDPASPEAATLLDHLLGRGAQWFGGLHHFPAASLIAGEFDVSAARDRLDCRTLDHGHVPDAEGVWTMELVSDRAFHPGRLMEQLELMAVGAVRTRGCCWLPTRPQEVIAWDGAGGQLAIGSGGVWGTDARRTRLVVTGIDLEDRDRVRRAFHDVLLTDFEQRDLRSWIGQEDGFDPWLGEIDAEAG